jgi:hypothetical protein
MTPIWAWAVVCAGCSGKPRDDPRAESTAVGPGHGPVIALIDSQTLNEPESLLIDRPTAVAAGANRALFVADMFHQRVIGYDATGRPTQRFGRKGSGPGEFQDIAGLTVLGDSLLAVVDFGRRRIELFDIRSGQLRPGVSFQGKPYSVRPGRADNLVIGNLLLEGGTSIALVGIETLAVRYLGQLPSAYSQSAPLAAVHSLITAEAAGSDYLIGFSGSQAELALADGDGEIQRWITIPRRLRRGVPTDVAQRFLEPGPFPELFAASSFLFGFHQTSRGVVVIHHDQDLVGKIIQAAVFVSLVTPDLTSSCVDGRLPIESQSLPVHTFQGDTLLFLTQTTNERMEARTLVSRWRVLPDSSAWVPTSIEPGSRSTEQ